MFLKLENMHWTEHAHSFLSISYPIAYFLYNNLHDYNYHRKYFLNQSVLALPEEFMQLLDNEFLTVSDRRLRPLRNTKSSFSLVDSGESETIGSFVFTPGCLFKIASRTALSNTEEIRKNFPNLSALLGKSDLQNVNVDLISDEELNKIILSETAKRYVLIREIIKGDSTSEILVPIANFLISYLATYPLISKIRPFIGNIPSLALASAISLCVFFLGNKFWKMSRILSFDKKICQISESYANGCREYLKKSQELGKILYKLGGAEKQTTYASNGDYLPDLVLYSKRLEHVENYLQKPTPILLGKNLKAVIKT